MNWGSVGHRHHYRSHILDLRYTSLRFVILGKKGWDYLMVNWKKNGRNCNSGVYA